LPFPDPHPGHPDLDPLDPLDELDDPSPSPVRRDNGNDLSKRSKLFRRGFPHTIPTIPIVSPFPIDGLDDPRPVEVGGGNGGELGRRMQVPEPVPDDEPADGGNGLARRERPTNPFPDPDYQDYGGSLKLKLKTRTPGQYSGIGGGVGLTHTGTEIGNGVSVDSGDQLKTRMLEQVKKRTPGPGQHSGVGGGIGVVDSGTGVNDGKTKRGVNTGIAVNNGRRAVGGDGPEQNEELAHWGVGNGIVDGIKDKLK
jgi:hypothetical protein